jgi:single-strand DNA-binding protein
MQDTNTIILVGRLARDPEMRSLPSGTSLCELRLAYTTSRKNGQTGEWEDQSNFVNVTVWGNQGESVARHLGKGSRVAVTGRLEHRTWEQDGNRREAHGIVANVVQFLDTKKDNQGAPAHSTAPASRQQDFQPIADDDIPF